MSAEILEQYSNPPEFYDPLTGHPDPEQLILDSLNQGTILAGREKPFTWELDDITSEGALHRYRAEIEVEALINLAERGPVEIDISEDEKTTLRSLYSTEVFDPTIVVHLDHLGYKGKPPLEHDVKAVEVYLAELLDEHQLGHLKEWVHFGMTSEDTNNLAYNLMLRNVTNRVVVPSVERVADRLAHLSTIYADTPTLGITHAQKASPTTVGKQFGYLLSDITTVMQELDGMRLSGKFSGAVGNHNPMTVLFPDFDYDAYSKDFVESLGFTYAPVENQRNDHLAVTELLSTISRLALVGKDATDNVWLQILGNKLNQRLVAGEKGSSTMSHKINPWRLENAEALFEQAIALMSRAPEGLVGSRHERDLSDHDWQRAYGDMIGRVVAGYNYFAVQLDRLAVDEDGARDALNQSAEVLSELVQTAGRVSGDPEAYDKVVALTQGKRLGVAGVRQVIDEALPDGELKDRVSAVTPESYVGTAGQKAREAVLGWHAAKLILKRGVLDESTSIDAVLFDLDDTLHFGVKDEVIAKLTHIFGEFETGFTDEEIREFSKMHDFNKMVEAMVVEHNKRHPRELTVEDFMEANGKVTGSFDHLFYAPPQSKEVIQAVRDSGKVTGLVTTRGPISLGRVLDLHGFSNSFDVIVGGGDVKRRKPHPEPLAMALGKLGIRPERSMYVGDDQDADVGAAMALGMKTALVGQTALDPYGPKPTYHWKDLQPLARLYGR
ncbi:MAG TPA: lyase family protein [Candidatus Saccharimonadales bacterium]|nr:lyase family protein [Candidatus Saccharimonadales bacterium]